MGTIRLKHSTNKYIKPLKKAQKGTKSTKNSQKLQITVATQTTTTTTTTTSTKMSSNKHSGLNSSRTIKTKKTSSKYMQNSKTMSKLKNFTIYSQNVFLDNSFVNKFNGEFDIEKKHNQGELYKAATKTTTKNLIFEKHNGKLRILETKNPEICNEDCLAVYNLGMRNTDANMEGKYHQWQKIADTSIILTKNVESFSSLGGSFEKNCSFNELSLSKINALTPEALACYANGGERYVGNLVLNNLGWQNGNINGGQLEIFSGNSVNNTYTTQSNEKFNLVKITYLSGDIKFTIYTPKISIKRCEMDKNNNTEFEKNHSVQVKDLACTNTVWCFSYMADGYNKTNKGNDKNAEFVAANVNRSPETVVEATRNEWKQEDKQHSRANKAYLSKIKKNKSLSKYQATVCY